MKRVLAMVALAIAAGCNPHPMVALHATPPPAPTGNGAPPLRITGVLTHPIVAQRGNRHLYQIAAHTYDGVSPAGAAHTTFNVADVTFFAKDGSKLEARAPKAVVDQATHTVTLLGGVHALSSDGLTLTCDTLVYRSGAETIHGEGNVRVANKQGNRMAGNRFDSDVSLEHIRIQ